MANEIDPDKAAAAHLLRRSAMSVHSSRVDELAGLSHSAAVEAVLNGSWERSMSGDSARDQGIPVDSDDWWEPVDWWVSRMTEEQTGLTDRMTWFWHSLLTTNAYKVSQARLVGEQLAGLRANARRDFRSLLKSFVASGALLNYLDASGSIASRPNENLARELMELYTVGRGNYSEDDVRAAARALSGWVVEDGRVEFRRENSFVAPLIFMGEQENWNTELIVDRLCDHPATASRIASLLWYHLVGTELDSSSADELGAWWQKRELSIDPLVERILTDPAFTSERLNRPRSGLEWFCAVRAAAEFNSENWYLQKLDQAPYLPPNPAGWPKGLRWLTAGSIGVRASIVHSIDLSAMVNDQAELSAHESIDLIVERCGLHTVTDGTLAALRSVQVSDQLQPAEAVLTRWRLAFTCPEFHLS